MHRRGATSKAGSTQRRIGRLSELGTDHIFRPLAVMSGMNLACRFKTQAAQGTTGHSLQGHLGFLRRAISLADVATETCRCDVVPIVEAPSTSWNHMVDRQRLA